MREPFQLGDVIEIAGVYADGTTAPNEGPIDHTKPMQQWRVKALEGADVVLQPLNPDGTVNEFLDAFGDYRIVANQLMRPRTDA